MKKIGAPILILGLVGLFLVVNRLAIKAVSVNPQVEEAKADLRSMVSALQMYKLNAGVYPSVEQWLVSLMEKPVNDPIPRRWVQLLAKMPKDPWGRDYRYVTRKKDDKILHIVVCNGPDPISEKDNLEEVLEEPKE